MILPAVDGKPPARATSSARRRTPGAPACSRTSRRCGRRKGPARQSPRGSAASPGGRGTTGESKPAASPLAGNIAFKLKLAVGPHRRHARLPGLEAPGVDVAEAAELGEIRRRRENAFSRAGKSFTLEGRSSMKQVRAPSPFFRAHDAEVSAVRRGCDDLVAQRLRNVLERATEELGVSPAQCLEAVEDLLRALLGERVRDVHRRPVDEDGLRRSQDVVERVEASRPSCRVPSFTSL